MGLPDLVARKSFTVFDSFDALSPEVLVPNGRGTEGHRTAASQPDADSATIFR
jgi:hypothetical protein